MFNKQDTINIRNHLAPLCGWKLIKPYQDHIGYWEKDGFEDVIDTESPIEHTIESAHNCLPDGVKLLKMEWDIDHRTKKCIQVIFLVLYENGSTQPFIIPTGEEQDEILWRLHLAIAVHDEFNKNKNKGYS